MKGKIVADFIAKFTEATNSYVVMEPANPLAWKLFVDGSSGERGSEASIVLESREGHKFNCVVRFGFKTSNNVGEYEVLLASLRL